jgi:hypothetical protein
VLSGEATHTDLMVFGLNQSGFEPTIYRTRGEHANTYTTDAVGLKGEGTQLNTLFQGKNIRIKYIKTEVGIKY